MYMQPNAFHAETIVPALEALLRGTTKKGSNRSGVARALARYKKAGAVAVPVLLELLDTETDQNLRRNTIRALGSLGAAAYPAVPRLIELLRESEAELTQSLVLAIRGIGPPAATALPQLISLLESGSTAAEPRYVLEAIGSIGPAARSAEDVVLNYVDDSDSFVPGYALEVLRKIGADSSGTIGALRRSLQGKGFSRFEALADAAADALVDLADASVGPMAFGLTAGYVRVADVLARLPEPHHVVLVASLRHPDARVREAAARGLAQGKHNLDEVLLPLTASLADEDPRVGWAANKTLRSLAPRRGDLWEAFRRSHLEAEPSVDSLGLPTPATRAEIDTALELLASGTRLESPLVDFCLSG